MRSERLGPPDPLLAGLPLLDLAAHLATANGYGYFRDELYYLACAEHLGPGYVDHPPLSILVLKAWTAVFGTSLLSLRTVPALAAAATVLLVGLLARRLGGGRAAQQMAMLAAVTAPMWLGLTAYYSMNALDLLFWALGAYLLAGRLLDPGSGSASWIALGLVLGLGLQNKISVLWLGAGIAAGLLLTDRRRLLLTRGPWLAGGMSMALFSPYVIWNVVNGLPTLEFMRNATSSKMAHHTAWAFAVEQLRSMGPAGAPIWIGGVLWLLLADRARPFRPLGVAFLAVWLFLAFSGTSRASYAAASYSWVLAAGGVALSQVPNDLLRRVSTSVLSIAMVVLGVVAAPFALPVLSVDGFIRYQAALGEKPGTEERKAIGELPQHWADRQGWPAIVDAFESAWKSLTPDERKVAALFASDYGVAGALDLFGPRRGMPRSISGHNSYWLWGPRAASGAVVIVHSGDGKRLEQLFTSVTLHGRIDCGRCMPYENGMGVWICRGAKVPLATIWPEVKNFS